LNSRRRAFSLLLAVGLASAAGLALSQEKPFEPVEGQAGKDVVWVPTPHALVEKMLDMAKLTPQDYVIDLGSGDGRNVIAAAKRGTRGHGVEYNPKMVELSRRNAAKAGVSHLATFIEGDMYTADISKATVMPLFLLTENLDKVRSKFLDLKPGSRIVVNGFRISEWEADATETAEGDCGNWCTAYLYIVPAKVAGTWRTEEGELVIEQKFQRFTGTLASGGTRTPIKDGRLNGDRFSFTAGKARYTGRVTGNTMSGETTGSKTAAWTATRK
jgi:precorrin-6B methylase 2